MRYNPDQIDYTNSLTFETLRRANRLRLPLFKNAKGEPAHSQPDGSDWSNPEWCNAVLGELGELANILKKVQRGDVSIDDARPAIANELADVVTYLDILAYRCGVDLGKATIKKWNAVSERVDVPLRIWSGHEWKVEAGYCSYCITGQHVRKECPVLTADLEARAKEGTVSDIS